MLPHPPAVKSFRLRPDRRAPEPIIDPRGFSIPARGTPALPSSTFGFQAATPLRPSEHYYPYLPSMYSSVRLSAGFMKSLSVGLCSTSTPLSMKMHSSLARRAWAMLCVTITIV